MRVSLAPGDTQLTRIPSPASSLLSPYVIDSTAPLEAAYQTYSFGPPMSAATDDNKTIEPPAPPCFFDMRRMACCIDHSAPSTLTSTTSRIMPESAVSSRPATP